MVGVAEKFGLDYRLIPVISIMESGGGRQACGYNAWGYDSCEGDNFSSWKEGIRRVAETLASSTYAGRSTSDMLCVWVSGLPCSSEGNSYSSVALSEIARIGDR